jgi:hypothetical protein
VKNIEKQWLSTVPWDRVLILNQTLCENQKTLHELKPDKSPAVRELWEKSIVRKMSLFDALDLCRRCCDMAPFTFNNGNTFATVGKTILEEWLNRLPSVEGQIARTTIGHYVADHAVGRRELHKVIKDFGSRWHINGVEHPAAANAAQLQVPLTGQVQPPAQA